MKPPAIKAMQANLKKAGFYQGAIDGVAGRMTKTAVKEYLASLMPAPVKGFPPTEESVPAFYGEAGNVPMETIELPFPIYYEGNKVEKLTGHRKVMASLARVFDRLLEVYPTEKARKAAGITVYDGLYNPRKKRGGTSWSMHAWAIAIDFNAGENGNQTPWPEVATMPLEVMECFAAEGWTPAGAFWGRDAMHFQATSP